MTEGRGKVEEGREDEGGQRKKKRGEVRSGGEREESEEGNHQRVEWPEYSTGEEGDDMKGEIKGMGGDNSEGKMGGGILKGGE